ncbi:hypothetical protein H6P81_003360 [Aristolochia fimbriata]|uniref:Uncharacterized protein n=1 Tax=Aristolochia fimbriata TaxID=158543 RepID=A0AAV7FGH0_ARIFI|nr:hypothetical protein H6P81_003360 [Aristolochia fimbriata]
MGIASLQIRDQLHAAACYQRPKFSEFLGRPSSVGRMEIDRRIPRRGNFLGRGASPLEDVLRRRCMKNGVGAGVLFISPRKDLLPYSFVLTQNCSNNEAEYQAILLGLSIAVEMKLPQLNIYGDSALIIKQITGEFEVKKLELVPFWRYARDLLAQFPEASLHYVPRSENGPADALAGIAASLAQFDGWLNQVPICERWVFPLPGDEELEVEQTNETEESFPISAIEDEVGDWREPISNFLRYGTLSADLLYEGLLLRCLSKEEGLQVVKETHRGICGAHQAAPKLHLQAKWLGYYWSSMLRDATEMARACRPCQLHADYIHQPPEPLHPTAASWPFEAWGMDIIGPITPKSDSDRQYILAATNYFSKWAEAAAYREVKATTITDFIRTQIIYRYGVPRYIVTDNADIFNLQPSSQWPRRSIQQNALQDPKENNRQSQTELGRKPRHSPTGVQNFVSNAVPIDSIFTSLWHRSGAPTRSTTPLSSHCFRRPMLFTSKIGGKFVPKWEGPYVVQEAYTNGAYKLVMSNGSELPITNGKFLKRF